MKVNFIGNFSSSMTGEMADEVHLAKSLNEVPNFSVKRIPRDIWQAYARGLWQDEWKQYLSDIKADINIVAKWDKFSYEHIELLRTETQAPIFYWTWDYMGWPETPEWHKKIAQISDLHLTNERGDFPQMVADWVKPYYFPMDVTDEYPIYHTADKKHDVAFFGSYFKVGNRVDYLKELAKDFKVAIYAPNYEAWLKEGFEAYPAVWGADFNRVVSETKVCLHFSVNSLIDGYWSNRIGKTLLAGGCLLAEYTKGMELSIGTAADYFGDVSELKKKVRFYLSNEAERALKCMEARELGELNFSSRVRMAQMAVLIERYLSHGI